MPETQKHRLLRYLTDTHATEVGGVLALKDLAAESSDPDLRRIVEEHIVQTQSQADRLKARIVTLGGDVSEAKSLAQSTMAKSSRLMNLFHDHEDKQTQDLIKAYALEHFEVGVYHSLSAYAGAIGDLETARLADTIREEERRAAERMEPFIPRVAVAAVARTQEAQPASGGPSSGGRKVLGVGLTPLLLATGAAALGVYGVSRLRGGGSGDDGAETDAAGPQSGNEDGLGALTSQSDTATDDATDVNSVIVTEEIIIVDLEDSAANRAANEE